MRRWFSMMPVRSKSLTIPFASKEYLCKVGLPLSPITPCITRVYDKLPRVSEVYDGGDALPENCRSLRAFASYSSIGIMQDVLSYYALEEPTGEAICVTMWIGKSYTRMFMNSSVSQFAEFLLIHRRYLECVADGRATATSPNKRSLDAKVRRSCNTRALRNLRFSDPRACAEADQFLRTGSMFSDEPLPTQEWTETIINMKRMGYWY